jgi:hypothetical protein
MTARAPDLLALLGLVDGWRQGRDLLARQSGQHLARAKRLRLAVQPGDVATAASASVEYARHRYAQGAARALDMAARALRDEIGGDDPAQDDPPPPADVWRTLCCGRTGRELQVNGHARDCPRSECVGCGGRGHHPTRHELECQVCQGTGQAPR